MSNFTVDKFDGLFRNFDINGPQGKRKKNIEKFKN